MFAQATQVEDVAHFIAKHNVQDQNVPSPGSTSLFQTIPGKPLHISVTAGLTGATHGSATISNDFSKKLVAAWLRKTSINIWEFADVDQSMSAGVPLTLYIDSPAHGENQEEAVVYVLQALRALCARGDKLFSERVNQQPRTLGISIPVNSTTSRSPM